MKQKSLTITLIVCAVLVVALLLAVVLISAKSENTAVDESLNTQQESSSSHSGTAILADKDYCMLTIDNWSAENGILTINAFAQAMISNDVTASARIELWKNEDVLTAHPITLGEGEASKVYESEVSVQFDIPEMGAEDELQLWFIIELSDDTVLFSSDASFYQEAGQLMIIAG